MGGVPGRGGRRTCASAQASRATRRRSHGEGGDEGTAGPDGMRVAAEAWVAGGSLDCYRATPIGSLRPVAAAQLSPGRDVSGAVQHRTMNRRFALIQALLAPRARGGGLVGVQAGGARSCRAAPRVAWMVGAARALRARDPAARRALAPHPAPSPASRPSARDSYGLTTVGYMGNNVLPARAGEMLRVVLLSKRTRREQAHAARHGRRRAPARRDRAGTDLRGRRLRRAARTTLPERPAVARGRRSARRCSPHGRRRLVPAPPPRRRARARLDAPARRRAARAARPRRASPCSPATFVIWAVEAGVYLAVARAVELDISAIGRALPRRAHEPRSRCSPPRPGYVGTSTPR